MRTLPDGCPRGLQCKAMARVESDDASTFVCCGLHDGDDDPFRMCFKSETTDSMYDHDEHDLLDMIEVASRAMSTATRIKEAEHGAWLRSCVPSSAG